VAELEGLGLDAVYVATLPGAHYPIVREIYARGIARHVFVEKSLAGSYADAREMCRLADEAGGVAMVGFQKRFGECFNKARELLAQDAIGEVESFDAYAYSSDFAEAPPDAAQAVSRGGVMRDQGSHAVDLAHWFFGDLQAESGDGVPPPDAPPDFSFGRVRTASGAAGSFSVSAQMADYRLPEIGMTIQGSDGTIKVNDDRVEMLNGSSELWHRQDLEGSEVSFLLGDPEYTRESEVFVAAVSEGRPHGGASFEDGARVEKVIDEIVGG
jgi:predicted dehydrogenase